MKLPVGLLVKLGNMEAVNETSSATSRDLTGEAQPISLSVRCR